MYLELNQLEVAREREVTGKKVIRRIISGVDVLEEETWAGSTIPICPVWGEEIMIDGKRYFRSMVRDAVDSQKMFNFWRSATTELVALAPRAPWVGPKGFIPKNSKDQSKWNSANNRSHAFLEYEGTLPPERQPFAGVPAGALQEALNASDDMKAIIGIYDSSLGARSNETSGRAILARQKEADVSNFHFIDNLSRAIQYCGKCLVEIIPHIYNSRQTLRILGDDQKEKVVHLGEGERQSVDGKKLYNLSVGIYDVTVDSGPSYATQREETRETLIEIMRSVPDAGAYMTDIIAEHMDFQGADKLAKRAKMLLPPNVQKAEMDEDKQDMPPEVQQALNQADQMIQQLQQQLQQATSEREPEMKRLEIETSKAQGQAQSEQAKMQLEQEKARAEIEFKRQANELDRKRLALEAMKVKIEKRKADVSEITSIVSQEGNEESKKTALNSARLSDAVEDLVNVMNQEIEVQYDEQGRVVGASRKSDGVDEMLDEEI